MVCNIAQIKKNPHTTKRVHKSKANLNGGNRNQSYTLNPFKKSDHHALGESTYHGGSLKGEILTTLLSFKTSINFEQGVITSHTSLAFPSNPLKTVKHSLNWMEHVNDFLTALKYGKEHSTTHTQPAPTAASSVSHAHD